MGEAAFGFGDELPDDLTGRGHLGDRADALARGVALLRGVDATGVGRSAEMHGTVAERAADAVDRAVADAFPRLGTTRVSARDRAGRRAGARAAERAVLGQDQVRARRSLRR